MRGTRPNAKPAGRACFPQPPGWGKILVLASREALRVKRTRSSTSIPMGTSEAFARLFSVSLDSSAFEEVRATPNASQEFGSAAPTHSAESPVAASAINRAELVRPNKQTIDITGTEEGELGLR